tara:strand:- start:66 stop:353 length:288 start_codon:yes stop_codon:yes gene_type:complete
MEEVRGKSLEEWKKYCESDDVPIKTMKYITILEERIASISVTRCCETLKTKDRIAFHVFAEINKYTKCFEGYKRDGKTFSETEVLKRYNTYLQSL